MRIAVQNDQKLVIDILSKSFDNNLSVNYLFKKGGKKGKMMKLLMEYSFFQGLQFGKIYISDDQNACCITLSPGLKKTTLKSIFYDLKLIVGVIGISGIYDVLKKEHVVKKHDSSKSFTHLWYIGVYPKSAGNGIGSRLLKEIIEIKNLGASSRGMSESLKFIITKQASRH